MHKAATAIRSAFSYKAAILRVGRLSATKHDANAVSVVATDLSMFYELDYRSNIQNIQAQ
jgi:hypothetical protein